MKNHFYGIVITIMLIIMIGCSLGTMKAKAEYSKKNNVLYLNALEKEYKDCIDEKLSKEGLRYSGITMTKIYDQEGNTSYKIKIHNEKLNELDEEHKMELIQQLKKIITFSEFDEYRKEFLILNS